MSIEFDAANDYYAVLGVPDTATIDELKTARKTLVLQYHPDVNPSTDAAVKFRGVQDAFEVLSDSSTRGKYDNERNRILSKDISELSAGYLIQQRNFNTTVKKAASSNWQMLAQDRVKTSAWQNLPLASKKVCRFNSCFPCIQQITECL